MWGQNAGTGRRVLYCFWIVVLAGTIPLTGYYYPPKEAGASVPWRPPKGVYGWFWFALVAGLVASWIVVARAADTPATFGILAAGYAAVVLSCAAWLVVYSKKQLYGVVAFLVLLCCWGFTVVAASSVQPIGGALLVPLGMWAIFQLGVNCQEVINLGATPTGDPSPKRGNMGK